MTPALYLVQHVAIATRAYGCPNSEITVYTRTDVRLWASEARKARYILTAEEARLAFVFDQWLDCIRVVAEGQYADFVNLVAVRPEWEKVV